MRFYGIPSEDRVLEIIELIREGEWVFEEKGKKEILEAEQVRERLRSIVEEVKSWKISNKHIPSATTFFFVHEPSEPKAFKIYDLSSLGCSNSLVPPRWKVYRKELSL